MSAPTRPRAPWYAPATRRLALLRVGLPTLLVCIFATGSAAGTPVAAAQHVAAAVVHETQTATSLLDDHHGGDRGDATDHQTARTR